jgi:hypothetical protein
MKFDVDIKRKKIKILESISFKEFNEFMLNLKDFENYKIDSNILYSNNITYKMPESNNVINTTSN